MELATLEWGPPEGLPFIALHGWLDNAGTFSRLAPLLSGLRLVAVDLPGHGRSPHREQYSFVDGVVDAVRLADRLGWERFSLLGHSMGAGVACLTAGTLPERVEHLALIEGLGPLSSQAEDAPAQLARALAYEARPPIIYSSYEQAVARIASTRGLSRKSAELLAERVVVSVPGGLSFGHDPLLRAPSRLRLTEPEVLAFFRRISCPTLVVEAENGMRFYEDVAEGRLKALQGPVKVVRLAGGHHLHLEDPEPVASEIRRFLGL
ncbi:alpha/beta hydrolase [bacterium CPR1]|nr:alpha/beta hydrolase [bacterium CPR1]